MYRKLWSKNPKDTLYILHCILVNNNCGIQRGEYVPVPGACYILWFQLIQVKTQLPHLAGKATTESKLTHLKTHLLGAIVHGVGIFGFFDYCQYPHSSNLTIYALCMILMAVPKLPPTLFLQV